MKRISLLIVVGVVLIMASGSAAAAPEIKNPDLISGESYTLEYDLSDGEEVNNVESDGPITIKSSRQQGGMLVVEVSADDVASKTSASIFIQTSKSERRTDLSIVPSGGGSGGGSSDGVSGSFEDQWINRRVNEIQTDRGVMTVYEQRDPTRGPIDPETGLPQGEWVEVPVNENGEPQWLFTDAQGLAIYMATKANTRYAERTRIYITAGGIVVVSLVAQWLALPLIRRRREENWWFGDNNKEGDQTGGIF